MTEIQYSNGFLQNQKYLGYRKYDLGDLDLDKLADYRIVYDNSNYSDLDSRINGLERISLARIREMAKEFYEQNFRVHDVYSLELDQCDRIVNEINAKRFTDAYSFYGFVNNELKLVSPFNLRIKPFDGHCMSGDIEKPLIKDAVALTHPSRKVYFSNITLGDQFNKLSACTLVHEIAHAEQESNIGYTENYFNKEFISIFLEKVAALEADPTGDLLELSEKKRFQWMYGQYNNVCFHNPMEVEKRNALLEIKSTLLAVEFFDMYQHANESTRREYFDDIQKVFDGKAKVEEIIEKRKLDPNRCLDRKILLNHI